jgi:hypothetical protein
MRRAVLQRLRDVLVTLLCPVMIGAIMVEAVRRWIAANPKKAALLGLVAGIVVIGALAGHGV